ncbi:MAG: hypothetical protein WBG50_03900 [Desulfomonilaceae bacterium]
MMSNKATSGKRQDELTVQTIRKTVRVFIKMAVDHLVKEKCCDRIKELTGVDLWFGSVPSPLLKRCCRLALADFYAGLDNATSSVDLMVGLARWTLLYWPDLVDQEFEAPDVNRLILGQIARSHQALASENVDLRRDLWLQSRSSLNLDHGCGHDATPDAA